MFKTVKTTKGEDTRDRIYDVALSLFRERGFDATTMRDIAAAAGMSLGAAYHYFPSKDAIVLVYYDRVSRDHARRVARETPGEKSLATRLRIAFKSKLEILHDDRPLMGALLRFAGDPRHPLSFFGAETRHHRLESMAAFSVAMGDEQLPEDLARIAPVALWALHMGLLLFFLHDSSPGARRTAALTTGAIDLVVIAFKLARLPLLRSLRQRVVALLDDAKLLPDLHDIELARIHDRGTIWPFNGRRAGRNRSVGSPQSRSDRHHARRSCAVPIAFSSSTRRSTRRSSSSGLPAMAAFALLYTRPRTAIGTINKVIAILLCLSGILFGEGLVCILFAAPIFFLVGTVIGYMLNRIMKKPGSSDRALRRLGWRGRAGHRAVQRRRCRAVVVVRSARSRDGHSTGRRVRLTMCEHDARVHAAVRSAAALLPSTRIPDADAHVEAPGSASATNAS